MSLSNKGILGDYGNNLFAEENFKLCHTDKARLRSLNPNQRKAFNSIMHSIAINARKLFFISCHDETGKTFYGKPLFPNYVWSYDCFTCYQSKDTQLIITNLGK